MTIIWCMVPEIWSVTDRIFCHFGPFFALLAPSPLPPDNSKNPNFEKMKKLLGDIIIFHMCTINDNDMMHGSWDMEHDGQNFLSFGLSFLPFYPTNNPKNQHFEKIKRASGDIIILALTAQKIKILQKWKKHLEISSFYNSLPKIMIICFTVPEIWYGMWQM